MKPRIKELVYKTKTFRKCVQCNGFKKYKGGFNRGSLICKDCLEPERTKKIEIRKCTLCKHLLDTMLFYDHPEMPNYMCKICTTEIFGYNEVKMSYCSVFGIRPKSSLRYEHYKKTAQYKDSVKKSIKDFKEKYPEKAEAWKAFAWLPKKKGYNLHHWSYNPEHYLDVISITKDKHQIIHKYLEYDQASKMYKDKASGFLLNTKSLHAAFLDLILETYHGMRLAS